MKQEIKETNALIAIFMGNAVVTTIYPGYWNKVHTSPTGVFRKESPQEIRVRYSNPENPRDWVSVDNIVGENPVKYHEDWNQLMKVVDKIQSLEIKSAMDLKYPKYRVTITYNHCYIDYYAGYNGVVTNIANNFGFYQAEDKLYKTSNLLATYRAVVKFIEWYNKKYNITPTYIVLKPEDKEE